MPDRIEFLRTRQKRAEVIIFSASLFVSLFWIAGQFIDVYRLALAGVLFEIFWLPMLLTTFVLPVLSFIFWAKCRFSLRSLFFYAILIVVVPVLTIILFITPKIS